MVAAFRSGHFVLGIDVDGDVSHPVRGANSIKVSIRSNDLDIRMPLRGVFHQIGTNFRGDILFAIFLDRLPCGVMPRQIDRIHQATAALLNHIVLNTECREDQIFHSWANAVRLLQDTGGAEATYVEISFVNLSVEVAPVEGFPQSVSRFVEELSHLFNAIRLRIASSEPEPLHRRTGHRPV
uniref:Head-tail connector protein n=1 Tax=uncultured marine virus TaxID=186617 RepID=A0A0F7L6N5_9VIRU|nr:head-tail connector protein [uncultured marine virus]